MDVLINIFFKANTLINWFHRKLTPKQFIIFSAILVGLTAGIVAVALKSLVHLIRVAIGNVSNHNLFLIALCPIIGITLTVLFVKYFLGNKLEKGLATILYAIAKKSSLIPKEQTYSHIITSTLTVGFGGSVGLESPIVSTGSAIGSNFGRIYKLNYKERTLLLASGAAAGIAAAFNTPIAGVLFALEVLLVEANISAFIPILIASASGALCSEIILNEDLLLSFKLQQPFDYRNVPYYILLGVFAGIFSTYYSKVSFKVENYFKNKFKSILLKLGVAGLVLFSLIIVFPPLLGEGYESIKQLSGFNDKGMFIQSIVSPLISSPLIVYCLLFLTLFLKPIAVGATLGSGGAGGNFAPSLISGALVGYLFSSIINELGIVTLPINNFTIVAMGGILSGVFHAPLTGIFLIAEITGGYELIIPLMLVSAISYAISKYFMPVSIDLKRLAEKEKIVTTSTDDYLLSTIDIDTIIEKDFVTVSSDAPLAKLIDIITTSKRNLFPITNKKGELVGLIGLDTIRQVMFKTELYDTVIVKQLMYYPKYVITEYDDVMSIMKLFDESQVWNLPVVNKGAYQGFISKSSILEKYREMLVQTTVE